MASSVLDISSSSSFSNAPGPERNVPSISYEEIAKKLLNEKLLLTALELHAELCETDRELPILKDFFSNPNNFELQNIKPEIQTPMLRSSSQATLDSLDMTRFSEDGAGVDDRVAVLEFELRKARENINALRANLTVVAETDGGIFDKKHSEKSSTNEHPIQPHEQRALNFLINEYLLSCSYKLTSITFSDENEDQDFEDWLDVGLNIPKPPGLVQIYREFNRSNDFDKPLSSNVSVQTETEDEKLAEKIISLQEENSQLLKLLSEQASQVPKVSQTLEPPFEAANNTNSNSTTPDKFELLESLPQDLNTTQEEPEEENDNSSIVVSLTETDPGDNDWMKIRLPTMKSELSSIEKITSSRCLPAQFRKEVLMNCHIETSTVIRTLLQELFKGSCSKDLLVHISAQTLPRIISNMLLNKREDSIPLILCTLALQETSTEREQLLQLLFNLKKKPQDEERQAVLTGLQYLFEIENISIELEEILTMCWEQSQHKYVERRLLAAECCSVLAAYAPSSIRNSLMISMLQQMLLEDKEPSVRIVVVKSLALLVAFMDDPDKYFQCEELSITALDDSSSSVLDVATTTLLPILAQWAFVLNRLLPNLIPRIVAKLTNQLKSSQQYYTVGTNHHELEKNAALVKVLQYLLPHLILRVANNDVVESLIKPDTSSELPIQFKQLCPSEIVNPQVWFKGDVDAATILNTFYSHPWETETWTELDWLSNKLVPEIIEIFKSVDIVTQEHLLNQLLDYLKSLCVGFQEHITRKKIYPVFKDHISELEQHLMELNSNVKEHKLSFIPAYLTIISTLSDKSEFTNALKYFLVALAISGASASSLRVSILYLCGNVKLQEHILAALWDGVVHQRSNVKCMTAALFDCLVSKMSEKLLTARIVPAIVTLANDMDLSVRAAAIPSLSCLITDCNVKEAQDKARLTLEMITKEHKLQDGSSVLDVPLVTALAAISSHCPQNYLEDVIVVQLNKITQNTLHQRHTKINLTNALVEAYSTIVYCSLSNQCMTEVLLPGLNNLDTLCNQVIPQQNTVRSLIKEIERSVHPKPIERSTSASSGLSLTMPSVNVGQGMEDMRQKMSKIFQPKSNSPGMSNFIFRKK